MPRKLIAVTVVLFAGICHPARGRAAVLDATFDDLAAGTTVTTITDGGVSFLNPISPGGNSFGIASYAAVESTPALAALSDPNVMEMGFGSAGVSLGAVGSYSFRPAAGGLASAASMTLVGYGANAAGDTLTLDGYLGGSLVGSSAYVVPSPASYYTANLSLPTGVYDTFTLASSGPANGGSALEDFDNVKVTTIVPEPATLGVVAAAGCALLCRRTGAATRHRPGSPRW